MDKIYTTKNCSRPIATLRPSLPSFGYQNVQWLAFNDHKESYTEKFYASRLQQPDTIRFSKEENFKWILESDKSFLAWAELNQESLLYNKAHLYFGTENNTPIESKALAYLITACLYWSGCDVLYLYFSKEQDARYIARELSLAVQKKFQPNDNMFFEPLSYTEIAKEYWGKTELQKESLQQLHYLRTRANRFK